jgi:hypothetical protein
MFYIFIYNRWHWDGPITLHTKHYITDAVLKGTYLITVDNVLHIDFTRFMPPVLPTIFNGCNCFVAMNIAAILLAWPPFVLLMFYLCYLYLFTNKSAVQHAFHNRWCSCRLTVPHNTTGVLSEAGAANSFGFFKLFYL